MAEYNPKKEALEFLKKRNLAVISTVNQENKPSAATVYYFVDDEFNLYFMTKTASRKYKNIQSNNNVAVVVGTENQPASIQIEGRVFELKDIDKEYYIVEQLSRTANNKSFAPPIDSFKEDGLKILQVVPEWIRFLDLRDYEGKPHKPFFQIIPS